MVEFNLRVGGQNGVNGPLVMRGTDDVCGFASRCVAWRLVVGCVLEAELMSSGWCVFVGFEELSALGWCVGVDLVAVAVDDHVVVVPAEGGEVVGVVGAALVPGDDVVGFESVAAGASGDGAGAVALGHESADVGWDGAGGVAGCYGFTVVGEDDADTAVTEEFLEG